MRELLAALSERPMVYAVIVGAVGALVLVIGEPIEGLLAALVPVMVVAAIVATLYLRRIYIRLPEPRPIFFRMLLEGAATKIAAGAIIGYIAVAFIVRDLELPIELPTPPPGRSTSIIAYVVVVLMTPPVYYALRVAALRIAAGRSPRIDDD
jgi:hypothetical protein